MKETENKCNLNYLSEVMGGKKNLIKEVLDAFLKQVPQELEYLNDVISKEDFQKIINISHTMKSSLSIVGASGVLPLLNKIERLGALKENIQDIKELGNELDLMCKEIIEEIKKEYQTFS